MSRRLLFPVVALVLVAGGFFALRTFLGRGSDTRGDAVALAPRGNAPSLPEEGRALPTPDGEPLPDAGGARAAVTVLELPEGAEAFSLDGARWIEGRVLFPLGAPPEPELAVVAIAGEDPPVPTPGSATWRAAGGDWRSYVKDSTRWSRRVIAADGSFRVPVPAVGQKARLFLDGRFLFLREPLELELAALEPVELEAELGAAIALRVTPPRNLDGAAAELVGAEVELTGAKGGGMFGMMGGGGGVRRTRELPEALELELGGLPADHTYFLAVDPKVFLGARELEVEVEPGCVKTLDIAIEPGATIAGRVLDGSGAPVEGARVSVDLKSQFARMAAGAERSAETAADGSFRLRGVQPRKLEVQARKDGLIEARSAELSPAAGQEIGGVELVMQRGATIAGHVRHADGAPASNARVSLQAVRRGDDEMPWNERSVTTTDAAGAFSRGGLSDERTYEVTATIGDEGEFAGYRARADGVAPGTRDLELVLGAPEGLTGLVRSDAGEPIRKYSIRAQLAESPFGRDGSVRAEVDDPDGRFRLAGVYRGSWTITVEAEGWVTQLETVPVEVPSDGSFEVVMLRAASIAGVVLDPTGEPAAGASSSVSRGAARSAGGGPFGGFTRSDVETTADAEGNFRFEGLRPGKVRIRATDEDWAPAPELALELVAGQELAGIVLNLGIGGTLTGEIFDAEGNPDAGRSINAMDMSGGGRGPRSATSDEAGHFVFEHLTPGSLMVMAQPRMAALAELAERDEDLSPVDFMESMKMKTVVIVENQTTHVVLGEPPANPVRLFGRVSEAGRAVETGTVMAVAEGRSIVEAWKPARVAGGGAYEMTVDEPGRYVLVYQAEAFQEGGIEFVVTVPEVSEHRCDLELPGGGISGTVFGPDGAPLRDVSVTLSRDSGVQATSIFSMGRRERSDESGRFSFDRLEAGSYSLRAGGQSGPGGFGAGGAADRLGAALVSDLVVEAGKTLGGVELRLKRAGGLSGTVIGSDGAPVAGATIFIRDAGGRPIQGFSTTVTDGEGRFEHASLAPGDYSVCARTTEAVSSASVTARVREGDTTDVQVRVEDGVMVRVVAETPEGDPTRAAVSVVDEEGREHANLRSMASLQTEFTEGLSTTEIRVGPVPPGKYVVTVTAENGQVEQRTITLSASRSERKLRLRFGE